MGDTAGKDLDILTPYFSAQVRFLPFPSILIPRLTPLDSLTLAARYNLSSVLRNVSQSLPSPGCWPQVRDMP